MRYLGLFIISSLFTLNIFAADVCTNALVTNADICNPIWAENVTLTKVQYLINQGFNFEQKCNNGNIPLSLLRGREFYFTLREQLRSQERVGKNLIRTIKSNKKKFRDSAAKERLIYEFLYRYRELPLNPVNYKGREDGKTALMWAAHGGYVWVVSELLNPPYRPSNLPKVAVDISDNEGKTALIYAVLAKDPLLLKGHSIRSLLSKEANIDAQDYEGKTPLMHAVLNSKRSKIKILIEKGANIDIEDHQGNTAIRHAARAGRQWAVDFLISKGATYNPIEIDGLLNSVPWYTRYSWDIGQYKRVLGFGS